MKYSTSWMTLVLVLVCPLIYHADGTCQNGIVCLTTSNYAFCFSGNKLVGNYSCPEGQHCIQGTDYPCQETVEVFQELAIEIEESTTVSSSLVTPPASCTTASKYPAQNCNQYYECVPSFWWYNLNLNNCSSGQAFDSSQLACVNNTNCNAETGQFDLTNSTTREPSTLESTTASISTESETESTTKLSTTELLTTDPSTTSQSTTEPSTTTELSTAIETSTSESTTEVSTTIKPSTTSKSTTELLTTIETTVTESTTTELTPVTPPSECTSARKYPAENCNQYYECVPFWFWYSLNLNNCSSGQSFSSIELACITNPNCNSETGKYETTVSPTTDELTIQSTTESRTTTSSSTTTATSERDSTTSESTTDPTTTVSTSLSTTPSATESISIISSSTNTIPSEPDSTTSKSTTESTTDPTTTISTSLFTTPSATESISIISSSTTTIPNEPVTPPAQCTTARKYPAANCNQYYECVSFFWWYNLNLYNCSTGQAFSTEKLECVADATCKATTTTTTAATTTTPATIATSSTTITTPSATTIGTFTTTPNATTTIIGVSSSTATVEATAPTSCDGPGKYPAPNCNQYYECLAVMYWYELVIQTCATGQSFNNTAQVCVTDSSCVT